MVAVEIRTPVYNEESSQIEWLGRALVRADGDDLSIYGDESLVDEHVAVVDQQTGKKLVGSDDPEAWARNLPSAYRSGDLIAVVLIDTDPIDAAQETSDPQNFPSIPAPPQPTEKSSASICA